MMKQIKENRIAIGLLIAAALIMICTRLFVRPIIVRGESMSPTLSDGQFLLGEARFSGEDIGYDTIVVFDAKTEEDRFYIKRVVGLPGDVLEGREDGLLYRNGVAIHESFDTMWSTFPATTVPAGEYFVMGDNRNHSVDSREFGPVAYESIRTIKNSQ